MDNIQEQLASALRELIGEDAEAVASEIVAQGDGKKYLDLFTADPLPTSTRSLIGYLQEKAIENRKHLGVFGRLSDPMPLSDTENFALRGGQPGNWFNANEDPYGGDGVVYEPVGQAVREQMAKKVRSAFATH